MDVLLEEKCFCFVFFQESTVKSTLMTAKAIPATMEPALTRSTGTSVPVNLATQVRRCHSPHVTPAHRIPETSSFVPPVKVHSNPR